MPSPPGMPSSPAAATPHSPPAPATTGHAFCNARGGPEVRGPYFLTPSQVALVRARPAAVRRSTDQLAMAVGSPTIAPSPNAEPSPWPMSGADPARYRSRPVPSAAAKAESSTVASVLRPAGHAAARQPDARPTAAQSARSNAAHPDAAPSSECARP